MWKISVVLWELEHGLIQYGRAEGASYRSLSSYIICIHCRDSDVFIELCMGWDGSLGTPFLQAGKLATPRRTLM